MKINCENCGKFVAEIKEGSKIRKGSVMLCDSCEGQRKIHKNMYHAGAKSNSPFDDFFGILKK